jgi:hypothetical protein
MENLRKLVFSQVKLKLFTNASISCLSHPSMLTTTWFFSVFVIACLRKITHFFIFHRAISEKLQHIKLWKFAVFHTSRGTSSLPSMNKIRDDRVFSLVHSTWNDQDGFSTYLGIWKLLGVSFTLRILNFSKIEFIKVNILLKICKYFPCARHEGA